jgi:sporulation protein YlmC with PRC-barrel domain
MNLQRLPLLALAAGLASVPVLPRIALAQTRQAAPNNTPGTTGAPTMGNSSPTAAATTSGKRTGAAALTAPPGSLERNDGKFASDENPVLTDRGRVRASRVIGSTVYNDQDQKIGKVDDIILGRDDAGQGDRLVWVVISVGGFLGIDGRLVLVPYSRLEFGNTHDNSDNRVLMPGATKASVGALKTYSYTTGG